MGHVFILGAGFSYPLGGPLFGQLLSTELQYANAGDIPDPYKTAITRLHVESGKRRQIDLRLGRSEPLNAELLLEQLDFAANNSDSARAKIIKRAFANELDFKRDRLEILCKLLKRVIAAQCDQFISELPEDSDRLLSHKKWFAELSADDTIVAFNYDTAVERISEICNRPLERGGGMQMGLPKLLKLHGSAEWVLENGSIRHVSGAYQADHDIAIGMPGEGKNTLMEVLREEWKLARSAIAKAELISIIGYSMPATDNAAREMILSSIAKNGKKPRVNLILGPDAETIVGRRMEAIVRPMTQKVFNLPMYAQDYIANVADYATYDFDRRR